jgi:hypothetical protein
LRYLLYAFPLVSMTFPTFYCFKSKSFSNSRRNTHRSQVQCYFTPRAPGLALHLPGCAASSFPGTPAHPPTSLPRPFDHWTHSHTPRFMRGFSDLAHSRLGVRPRLSPHPGHDDWNPGQLGFRPFCKQNRCQIVETQNSAIFLAFLRSPTLDILDNFRQCPKCPNRRPPEVAP